MYTIKKEKTKVEIELTVDPKEWEKGVEKVYQETKGKYAVIGFRKGHAPRKVIENTYGDGVFFDDTVNFFVEEAINNVLDSEPELEPVAMPTTQFESYTLDGGLKMKIFFDVVPDFELCKYKGVEIKVHKAPSIDHQVEHEISHLLADHAKFETVDREVQNGDSVLIDFTGFIDGVEFDGGSAKGYALEIGSHSFIDTFEDQLVGAKKGDKVDVKVTFPENYGAPEFAGKKATFEVVINEVREKILPELNDKFIADATEFESVEEYRKDTIAHIQTMNQNEAQREFEYNMRDYLIENTNIELPDAMVETRVKQDLAQMTEALKAYNMTVEQYLAAMGMGSVEDYLKRTKEQTIRGIKVRYIYRKIIDAEKLAVPADELASATKGKTDRDEIVRIENELLLKVLHKFLADNNKIVEVESEECDCGHHHHH